MIESSLRCLSGSRLNCQLKPIVKQRLRCQIIVGGLEPFRPQDQYEQSVTFLTSDGLVQLPVWRPKRKVSRVRQQAPLPNFQEQGLCVGNSFWVTATNGMDICRRLNLLGYCRCTELLSDNVEDIVLSSGGEVVAREYKISSGLHESLHMTVAIPLLWGIPPRHEALSTAIATGGGFVDKVYKQWQLFG